MELLSYWGKYKVAILINPSNKKKLYIRANHSFGSGRNNITVLNNRDASKIHASIKWDGNCWYLVDHSHRGTYINSKRIESKQNFKLSLGMTIQFATSLSDHWEVVDLNPPRPCLIIKNSESPKIELHDVDVFPADDSEIVLYLSEQGKWECEHNLQQGEEILSSHKMGSYEKKWLLVEDKFHALTELCKSFAGDSVCFHFSVSQNEEHVRLLLKVGQQFFDLEERAHHYLLLLLARKRLLDQQNHVDIREQGWIKKELLIKMLGMHEQHINIQIYRFRKQIETVVSNQLNSESIVERRPGELRFAYPQIHIEGGAEKVLPVELLSKEAALHQGVFC